MNCLFYLKKKQKNELIEYKMICSDLDLDRSAVQRSLASYLQCTK